MKALVYVTLKPDVLDPQGSAIQRACGSLGYQGVQDVRQGKLFEIKLDATDEAALPLGSLDIVRPSRDSRSPSH